MIEFIQTWWKEVLGLLIASLALGFRDQIFRFCKFFFTNKLEETMTDLSNEIVRIEEESNLQDENLSDQISEVQDTLDLLQQAILSSHRTTLIQTCKEACCKGEISADDLDIIERDYETYKALGGNGHMDSWMAKVRRLPIVE